MFHQVLHSQWFILFLRQGCQLWLEASTSLPCVGHKYKRETVLLQITFAAIIFSNPITSCDFHKINSFPIDIAPSPGFSGKIQLWVDLKLEMSYTKKKKKQDLNKIFCSNCCSFSLASGDLHVPQHRPNSAPAALKKVFSAPLVRGWPVFLLPQAAPSQQSCSYKSCCCCALNCLMLADKVGLTSSRFLNVLLTQRAFRWQKPSKGLPVSISYYWRRETSAVSCS